MAAIFFDIDGTLWDQKSEIPESTVTAVRRLHENGHLSFLCSGRSRVMIFGKNLMSLAMDGILAGCGTYIEYQGRELWRKELDPELIAHTTVTLERYHMPMLIEGHTRSYMDREMLADRYGAYLKKTLPEKILMMDETKGQWRGSKFSVITWQRDYKAAAEELAEDYEILQHGQYVMELVPKGFSKATGIRKVCELLGISHEETYAVGDSVNDCDMLRYAAHGIAMGSGRPEAKEAADYVTAGLHEDGVYLAMEHYGLI